MTSPEARNGNGDSNPASGRRPEFRLLGLGAIVKEANVIRDVPAVLEMYKSPHAISHLADVTPETTVDETARYYFIHPEAKLFVATLPDNKIIGAMTVAKEEGLYSAKFSRLVTFSATEYLHKGVARVLVRRGLSYAFSGEDAGGLGVSSVTVAVILGLQDSQFAIDTFEKAGFELVGIRYEDRCKSWDPDKGELVFRDVRQLVLQRSKYVMRYGNDLAKPSSAPANK